MNPGTQMGTRIREERERRGWSQQAAANAVGVRREMWAKYEAGSEPGAKALAGMAAADMDVIYILTGQHSSTVPLATDNYGLSQREERLIEDFRSSLEYGKEVIEGAASAAARVPAKRAAGGD